MRKIKNRPMFRSEKQEAAFWASHDSAEYIDYSKSTRTVFPRLKPSTETISLRLPKSLLDQLKTLANKRNAVSDASQTLRPQTRSGGTSPQNRQRLVELPTDRTNKEGLTYLRHARSAIRSSLSDAAVLRRVPFDGAQGKSFDRLPASGADRNES